VRGSYTARTRLGRDVPPAWRNDCLGFVVGVCCGCNEWAAAAGFECSEYRYRDVLFMRALSRAHWSPKTGIWIGFRRFVATASDRRCIHVIRPTRGTGGEPTMFTMVFFFLLSFMFFMFIGFFFFW